MLSYNREIFLLNYADQFHAFHTIDRNFPVLDVGPQTRRDRHGKSYLGFLPPLMLIRRQANAAFYLLSCHLSSQAWVLLRPALEAALMVGKWADDPDSHAVWEQREQNPDLYYRTYTGKKLRSVSLDRSGDLQDVLRRINDDFIHANPAYYHRQLGAARDGQEHFSLWLNYVDEEDTLQPHLYAFLHLLFVLQESLWRLCAGLFGDVPPLPTTTNAFESYFSASVRDLALKNSVAVKTLDELGLWQVSVERKSN
jgi:hypothetical protein